MSARFRVLETVADYPVWVNPQQVQRVWFDEQKDSIAIMYTSGAVDHLKETSIKKVLRRLR